MSRQRREPPAPSRGGREVRAPRRGDKPPGAGDEWSFPDRETGEQSPPPSEDTEPSGEWEAVREYFEEAEELSPLPQEASQRQAERRHYGPDEGTAEVGAEPSPEPPPPRGASGARSVRPRHPDPTRKQLIARRRRRALVAAVAGLAVLALVAVLFQPFKGDGQGEVRVVIPKGSSAGDIGKILDRQGVVSSAFLFNMRATIGGKRGALKPGTYTLASGMSYGAALDALSKGPQNNIVQAVVLEGLSRKEIAPALRKQGLDSLSSDYLKDSARSPQLRPSRYGAKRSATLEGFLFPATYDVRSTATSDVLVSKQIQAFKRNFGTVNLSYAKRKNLTDYDVLIIASMIEREASLDRERPLVAAVIYNRLKQGIPLGIDATTRFELGNWTKPLKASELQKDSPYNTRTRQGLPPGPIGNPGLASIKAAARPARVGYLFYVAKPCQSGEHVFTKTDAEFEKAAAHYKQVVEQNGGQVPKKCR